MHQILLLLLLSTLGLSFQSESQAAVKSFKLDHHTLLPLAQYKADIQKRYPFLDNNFDFSQKISWNNNVYPGLILKSNGIDRGTKFIQELQYVELHPGLWRMTSVDAKVCEIGTVMKDGKWSKSWGCNDIESPIGGSFANIYFLSDKANISLISMALGKKIKLQQPAEVNSPTNSNQEVTLGDTKNLLLNLGTTWRTEPSVWHGIDGSQSPGEEGLLIHLEGQVDNIYSVKQSFLYVYRNNKKELQRKTIDGKICFFSNAMQKQICDPLYQQTPATPMPLVMVNSDKTSTSVEVAPKKVRSLPSFQCGNLSQNIHTIFKFHSESSIFSTSEIQTYREAFSKIPLAIDPLSLFLPQKTKALFLDSIKTPYPSDPLLHQLQSEVAKGPRGNCSSLNPILSEMETIVLEQAQGLQQVLKLLKSNKYDHNLTLNSLEERHKIWWTRLKNKAELLTSYSRKAAFDIAAAEMSRYAKTTLNRFIDPEDIITTAFSRRDSYSQLFELNHIVQTSLTGTSKNLFFGLSITTGHSGNHYIHSVHPTVASQHGLKIGDQIITVNDIMASEITSQDLDQLLTDTRNPIALVTLRENQSSRITLKAQNLDFMKLFYELKVLEKSEKSFLKISLKSFEAGVSESLRKAIDLILEERHIDGFILDLKSNPGGNTQEATRIISLFVKDRIISYYKIGARGVEGHKPIYALPDFFVSDTIPLVVEVNAQTKSAAEITASALKSLKRSVTVGTQTYGKLVGQSYNEIELMSKKKLGLLVTSFEFFNSQGQSLNQIGVTPDFIVEGPEPVYHDDGLSPGKNLVLSSYADYKPYTPLLTDLSGLVAPAVGMNYKVSNITDLSIDLLLTLSDNQRSDDFKR